MNRKQQPAKNDESFLGGCLKVVLILVCIVVLLIVCFFIYIYVVCSGKGPTAFIQ